MAKRRKVLAFCFWLNRAGRDVVLGRSNSFISEIPLKQCEAWDEFTNLQ